MEKRKITLTAIILGVVLVALFGSTYAYFTSNNDPQNSAQAIIQTGALSLILDDVDGITEEDKIDANHTETVKYFSLTNSGAADAYANLIWKGLLNTFVRDDLVYELEEVQADKTSFSDKRMVVTETVVPKTSTNENVSLANGILVKSGTVTNNTVTPNIQYYKLTVKYKYSETENQNDDLNKVLVSGFDLGEGVQQKVRVTLNIGEDATISSNTADVTYTGTYESLPTPVRSGYKFGGWYTDSAYTNRVLSTSMVSTSNTELYAKWEKIPSSVYRVDTNGSEITNNGSFNIGDRIAIGRGENIQYFRYLYIKNTKLILFAEHNLIRVSSTVIAENALQDSNNNLNAIKFINNVVPELQVYMDNYANTLNKNYFNNQSIVSSYSLTVQEAMQYFGCPSGGGACSNIQSWASNSNYWLGTSYGYGAYQIKSNQMSANVYKEGDNGARPVIEIDASLLQ